MSWAALPRLHVTADWRYTAPDLFLARNSILSVFSAEDRNDVGGGVRYEEQEGIDVGVDYHLVIQPATTGTTSAASPRAAWVGAWRHERGRRGLLPGQPRERLRRRAAVRASGLRPVLRDRGRARARLRGGSERRGLLHLRHALGQHHLARLQRRRCGARRRDPFLEQTYDVMAKLVYNQTYRIREVRNEPHAPSRPRRARRRWVLARRRRRSRRNSRRAPRDGVRPLDPRGSGDRVHGLPRGHREGDHAHRAAPPHQREVQRVPRGQDAPKPAAIAPRIQFSHAKHLGQTAVKGKCDTCHEAARDGRARWSTPMDTCTACHKHRPTSTRAAAGPATST